MPDQKMYLYLHPRQYQDLVNSLGTGTVRIYDNTAESGTVLVDPASILQFHDDFTTVSVDYGNTKDLSMFSIQEAAKSIFKWVPEPEKVVTCDGEVFQSKAAYNEFIGGTRKAFASKEPAPASGSLYLSDSGVHAFKAESSSWVWLDQPVLKSTQPSKLSFRFST